MHNNVTYTILRHMLGSTTLNIPISKGGTNSSHMHNQVKSQRYEGVGILLSDTEFMNA